MKLSKRANVLYFPPKLLQKISDQFLQAIRTMYSIYKESNFNHLKEIFTKAQINFNIDFNEYPNQYEKFIGKPYPVSIVFNFKEKGENAYFCLEGKDFSIIKVSLVENLFEPPFSNYSVFLVYDFILPSLKHEIIHSVQHAITLAWNRNEAYEAHVQTPYKLRKPPQQFHTDNYVHLDLSGIPNPNDISNKDLANSPKLTDYFSQMIEIEPYIVSAVNEFMSFYDMNDLNAFLNDCPFFIQLKKKDPKLFNFALKKFYKIFKSEFNSLKFTYPKTAQVSSPWLIAFSSLNSILSNIQKIYPVKWTLSSNKLQSLYDELFPAYVENALFIRNNSQQLLNDNSISKPMLDKANILILKLNQIFKFEV